MFENQPKGLYALALANTGERFGYYTMLAVFALFLRANFGLDPGTAGLIYSSFLGLVYFLPLVGGILADMSQHTVKLTQDFYIGVFECTQKQWKLVMGTNPSEYLGDCRPVECTSYNINSYRTSLPAVYTFRTIHIMFAPSTISLSFLWERRFG